MRVIRGKKDKKVSWPVKGDSVGTYIISVSVSGEVRGDIVSADAAIKITLKEKSRPPGQPFNLFQRFFDFFQGLFKI